MFAPLLSESLNGFAVLDWNYVYAWVSESMCNLLECNKSQLLGYARIPGARCSTPVHLCSPNKRCASS